MFKVDDKVVCVDPIGPLKINEIYIIKGEYTTIANDFTSLGVKVQIYNDTYAYNAYRFKTLKEYRKQKLDKICSNQVIK